VPQFRRPRRERKGAAAKLPGGAASFHDEPRLVECPRGDSIALSRAGKCSDDSTERRSIGAVLDEVRKPFAYLTRN